MSKIQEECYELVSHPQSLWDQHLISRCFAYIEEHPLGENFALTRKRGSYSLLIGDMAFSSVELQETLAEAVLYLDSQGE